MDNYRTNPDFHIVDILGDSYLAAGKKARKESPLLTPVNELGAFIWNEIDKGNSIEIIGFQITETYDISYDQAYADVESFCNSLYKKGFLIRE